jgi:hypothetical protein
MTTRTNDQNDRKRRFITFVDLCKRWGDCAHMTVEFKIRKDPNFPRIYTMGGRIRLFDLEEVEAYERASVVSPTHRYRSKEKREVAQQ